MSSSTRSAGLALAAMKSSTARFSAGSADASSQRGSSAATHSRPAANAPAAASRQPTANATVSRPRDRTPQTDARRRDAEQTEPQQDRHAGRVRTPERRCAQQRVGRRRADGAPIREQRRMRPHPVEQPGRQTGVDVQRLLRREVDQDTGQLHHDREQQHRPDRQPGRQRPRARKQPFQRGQGHQRHGRHDRCQETRPPRPAPGPVGPRAVQQQQGKHGAERQQEIGQPFAPPPEERAGERQPGERHMPQHALARAEQQPAQARDDRGLEPFPTDRGAA